MFKHHTMQTYSGAKEYLHTFLVLTMNVSCQLHVSYALSWDRAPLTYYIGGWVGLTASQDALE